MMRLVQIVSWPIAFALSASLGLLSICSPVWLYNIPLEPADISPLVRTGIEKMGATTLVFLFLSGFLLGILFSFQKFLKGLQPVFLGVATFAAFPILTFAEMAKNPYSHNLFPIEFAVYLFLALVPTGGAFAGRRLLRRFWRLRRGLCPKCAYPMGESSVCTECGCGLPKRARTT